MVYAALATNRRRPPFLIHRNSVRAQHWCPCFIIISPLTLQGENPIKTNNQKWEKIAVFPSFLYELFKTAIFLWHFRLGILFRAFQERRLLARGGIKSANSGRRSYKNLLERGRLERSFLFFFGGYGCREAMRVGRVLYCVERGRGGLLKT